MTIISGVNCENTAESIEMAKEAKEAGADGILLMPPHMWLRFGMNPDAPFEYVKDVAEYKTPRRPMLAHKYKDKHHVIKWVMDKLFPGDFQYASRKLNGIRCFIFIKDSVVTLF